MLDRLISEIQKAVTPHLVEVNGEQFLSREVCLPPEPRVTPLKMATLTGLFDFIDSEPERFIDNGSLIQVVSPTEVRLYGDVSGRDRDRDCWAIADCSPVVINGFKSGEWYSPETFIVMLQTAFVSTDNRSKLLQLVGGLSDETSKSLKDDGVSQTATVKTGVSMVAEVKIKNPVGLAPFRTFHEVEQPESEFVFRLRKGREQPECSLWTADGGSWKISAIASIKSYLEERITHPIPILA